MTTKQQREARPEFVRKWLKEATDRHTGIPLCEIAWDRGCQGRAIEAHEPLTRARGGDITDRKNVLLTCRYCHNKAHDNPKEAEKRGFLAASWDESFECVKYGRPLNA